MGHSKLPTKESKLTAIKKRIALVESFLSAKKLFQSKPDEALAQCYQMIERGDLEVYFIIFYPSICYHFLIYLSSFDWVLIVSCYSQ